MSDLREKIKAALDRECRNHFLEVRRDAERKEVATGGLPRCDDYLAFPNGTLCWMCHKNDALAQEIELLKESG